MVSDAVVNYFLVDLEIERHFVALHRYLLLQDGEYTQSLTDQLFSKVGLAIFDIKCTPLASAVFSPNVTNTIAETY